MANFFAGVACAALGLTAAACSQDPSPSNVETASVETTTSPAIAPEASDEPVATENQTEVAPAGAAPSATPVATSAPGVERRCGWLSNPTPSNFWLNDADSEWIISAQGGYQAEGMDTMSDMSSGGWVETNGSYGYGCACVDGVFDAGNDRVTRIVSATPRPLAQCRADKALPSPTG